MSDQGQQSYDRVQKEEEADNNGHSVGAAGSNDDIVFGSGCPVRQQHHHHNNANHNDMTSCPVPHHASPHHHQEASHDHPQHDDHSHHRHNNNPKELHTAESILEYMNDRHPEHSGNNGEAHHREADFKKYLEAQRHLKSKRRLSFAGLRASTTSRKSPEEPVNADTTSQQRQESRNRRATMHAMSVLGGRQAGLDAAEFDAFLNDAKNHSGHFETSANADGDQEPPHGQAQSLSIPWYCRPVQRQRYARATQSKSSIFMERNVVYSIQISLAGS